MSITDIRLISSVCNDNQTFLVEYTPYDNLQIVKRALEQCHEAKRTKKSPLLLGVRTMAFKNFLRIQFKKILKIKFHILFYSQQRHMTGSWTLSSVLQHWDGPHS